MVLVLSELFNVTEGRKKVDSRSWENRTQCLSQNVVPQYIFSLRTATSITWAGKFTAFGINVKCTRTHRLDLNS